MRYDLDLIRQLCSEVGLSVLAGDRRVEVDLGQGAVLCFQNAEREEDCLIGFLDTPWHTHDNLMFTGARGHYIELDYLDLVVALREGRVLVCERFVDGRVADRWLIHRDYNDEFKYMEEGEQIVVRRATTNAARTQQSA
jgi:hypothetical protein